MGLVWDEGGYICLCLCLPVSLTLLPPPHRNPTPGQQEGILNCIESIIDLDAPACVKAFDDMGLIKEGADMARFEDVVSKNFAR